jgi:hypothetical protein
MLSNVNDVVLQDNRYEVLVAIILVEDDCEPLGLLVNLQLEDFALNGVLLG